MVFANYSLSNNLKIVFFFWLRLTIFFVVLSKCKILTGQNVSQTNKKLHQNCTVLIVCAFRLSITCTTRLIVPVRYSFTFLRRDFLRIKQHTMNCNFVLFAKITLTELFIRSFFCCRSFDFVVVVVECSVFLGRCFPRSMPLYRIDLLLHIL